MPRLYRDNRTFFSVEDDTWIALALWAIIALGGISYNVNRIINFIFEKQIIWDSAIINAMSAVFILLGTAAALKKMERREFILILFIGTAGFLSAVLNETSRYFLSGSYFTSVFVYGFCGIICISHYKNWEKFQRIGLFFTVVGLAIFFIRAVIVINHESALDYMSFSYESLIFVIAAFWYAFNKNNIIMWIAAPIGLILIMIVGCRGALLCILVYVLLEMLLSKKMHAGIKAFLIILIVLVFFNLENIMLALDGLLRQYGYASRTLEKFFEGTLQDDSGRSNYYKYAWEITMEHPLFGCGMAGSSSLLYEKIHGFKTSIAQGSYAHNLFLDVFMHFGVFGGVFISVWIVVSLIRAYIKSKKNSNILFFFFSIVFPKLMLSSTYLAEPEFFVLLGLLLNIIYDKSNETPEIIQT